MSGTFFEELGIPIPKHNLGVGSGTHAYQTGSILMALEKILEEERPDVVLVYGDTNSTLAAALTAAKLHVPVCHVEAGLRSHNRRMPEETNRVVTDHLSSLLLCPSDLAAENLKREGVRQNVHITGDVMYDCLLQSPEAPDIQATLKCLGLDRETEGFYLATLHRPENTEFPDRLTSIFEALNELEMPIVIPLHPRTRNALEANDITLGSNLHPLDPVPYRTMQALMRQATTVFTDSGGVQREAFYLQTPCVTLRDETEWPETVAIGWNVVTGADKKGILKASRKFRQAPSAWNCPYGDGTAAEEVARKIQEYLR
tara:strand:- start:405 stop:1349 length:945 start_codon:yes stop_codon:yes gene_type:complete